MLGIARIYDLTLAGLGCQQGAAAGQADEYIDRNRSGVSRGRRGPDRTAVHDRSGRGFSTTFHDVRKSNRCTASDGLEGFVARVRAAVAAAVLVSALAPLTFGGAAAVAAPVPTAAAGTSAEAGSVRTVVQEGGRLTVPAGEEGAVTLRFTATLPAGTRGPVTAVLRMPDTLVARAGGSPVSENVIRSTCTVNGVAYGACPWHMPFVRAGESVDKPSLDLPTVPAAGTLAYAVTMDADRTAGVLGRPDARVELKDNAGTVVAEGTVRLDFVLATPPASQRGALHARDKQGVLWRYEGTGDVTRPFATRKRVGGGWNAYTVVAPLSGVTAGGTGSLVARDRAGVLWYYEATGNPAAPFAPRERVGGGWNIYTAIVGTGDGSLVARDRDGVLWIYDESYNSYGRFKPRTRVGGGWNTYNALVRSGGWEGVLGRDKDGVLWKYAHKGCSPCAPFEARQRIGGGWNIYTALAGTAELGRDEFPDLVARDAAGKLWLYQGVPVYQPGPLWGLTVPGSKRSLIGGGWNVYDLMF
ncbi:tachylectin-related carbohydrate-binding protein [Streptomyces sp. NPDC059083]|uniref:tachylectin-related carbohydrate-binding protein n=1 Tax=Streptomyces sp. NPDC059083 TaxID=3346721 RepID=UPI0036C1B977